MAWTRKCRRCGPLVGLLASATVATGSAAAQPHAVPDTTYVRSSSVEGHLEVLRLASEVLGEARRLFVWLPPSYATSETTRRAVIYAFDGQDLFDASTASGGDEWALDELLQRRPEGVVERIVVGIEAGRHPAAETTLPGEGRPALADRLVRCLLEEVVPLVESRYRVQPERAGRWVLGMGNAARLALYVAWQHADRFRGAIGLAFPDVDAHAIAFTRTPPSQRPWLWIEQRSAEKSRASNAELWGRLRRHARLQLVIAGETASRPLRLLRALRALP